MSFPHRTWFYDRRGERLISPDEAWDLDCSMAEQTDYKDAKLYCDPYVRSAIWYRWNSGDQAVHKDGFNYIPLPSTGLEDSEGREIIEGHLLESATEHHEFFAVVEWSPNSSAFRKVWYDPERAAEPYENWDIDEYGYRGSRLHTTYYLETSQVYGETTQEERIVGHALIHPDMVPDGFDTEEYWDLE